MGLHYAQEKFGIAVDTLATGRGRINERLIDAFIYLTVINSKEDLPEGQIRDEYEQLMEKATASQPTNPKDGTIQATIKMMSEEEAVELAKKLCYIAYRLDEIE